MENDDGSPPELWNPEPGEFLVATFVRYETRYSKKMNADVQVAVVYDEEADTRWSIWLSREVLKREFERQAPREGDMLGIRYHGRKQMPDGSDGYHRYSVQVDRDPGRGTPAVPVAAPSSSPTTSAPSAPQPAVAVAPMAPNGTSDDDELPW